MLPGESACSLQTAFCKKYEGSSQSDRSQGWPCGKVHGEKRRCRRWLVLLLLAWLPGTQSYVQVRCSTKTVVWVERVVKYSRPTWQGERSLLASLVYSQAACVCLGSKMNWLSAEKGCAALCSEQVRAESEPHNGLFVCFTNGSAVFLFPKKALCPSPSRGSSGDRDKGCLAVCSCSMHPASAGLFLKPPTLIQQ